MTTNRPAYALTACALIAAIFLVPSEQGNAAPPPQPSAATPLPPARHQGPLYQLNLYNYTPAGTIRAATRELPRLAQIGVGTLWVMPVHPRGKMVPSKATLEKYKGSPLPVTDPQPFAGNPYCPSDHTAIDPALGTPGDFKNFVSEAHGLGMRVILGWVPNHTSWDSRLIAEHPEFFMRGKKGQVLYHNPWDVLARLDYKKSPELWNWMLDTRNMWVETYGIDGFREDVANRTPLPHWTWLRERMDPERKLFFLAEADSPALLGPLDAIYDWEMPAVFWQIAAGKAPATLIDETLAAQAKSSPHGGLRMRHLFNHDQTGSHRPNYHSRDVVKNLYGAEDGKGVPTHREKYGPGLEAFALLNFTLPGGIPMIFMGEEIGFYKRIPHNHAKNYRIPFRNAPDPDMPAFYKKIAGLYNGHPAIREGGFRKIHTGKDDAVYAFVRELDGDRVTVAVNLSPRPQEIETEATGKLLLKPWGWHISTPR